MRLLLSAAVAALLVTSTLAQDAHHFSAAKLTALPTTSWPTNGGNLFNQRYSPLKAINRTNVAQLKGVWRARLRGSGTAPQYSGFAQPLVYDGVAYVSTGANDVFALSIDTGEILWQYTANLDPNITSVCCGWNNKGVAISDDKVFIGQLDGKLLALDRATGKVAWSIQAERWQENFSITAAPLYVEGLSRRSAEREGGTVIIGFAGGDRGTRSRVKAYDAKDGRLIWTFYTIPGPGEPGHDTWPKDNDAWKYGGAAIWQTPAVDLALGLVYFSTGNAAPDYNGAFRAGDNLYAASMVAIELATGKYRWHFQQVHHDIWDYDAVNPVVLMDVNVGGRTRKAIAEVGKTGWAYILDRENGKPLIGIDEKPVPQEPRQATAKTQPFPRGDAIVPQLIEIAPEGHALVNDGRIFTPFVGSTATIVAPGIWGGASWPPSAYDPVQQRLFVCASSVINGFTGGGDPKFVAPVNGSSFLGGATTFTRVPRTGIIAALDVTTNKLAWRSQWPEQCYSGTAATGGGLLFVGRNDGRLLALDSSTGKQLWEFQTGAGMHAPVSTFEHTVNGVAKQYVLAFSAGSALIGSARGDSVWLFGLDGTLPPVQSGTPVSRTAAAAPAPPTERSVRLQPDPADVGAGFSRPTANLVEGKRLFVQVCAACHGDDGKGGHTGGAPLDRVTNLAAAIRTVTEGRNTNMPSFRSSFTPEQIRDVSAYVVETLSGRAAR
ncbi:MAG TPA: PQQ-binding-like beta-propeller repeat protein [Vicinamibacterales bacterium]|nr:PQQ-binding-like beta-propeller repeat protein [Vicinamibacterales bacterium]